MISHAARIVLLRQRRGPGRWFARHQECPCREGAFTLVELLTVVSIVALLLSMLLPSLAGARAQARSVLCGSNIRQIATANLMYGGENGDRACPGAADFLDNLHRWHGTRGARSDPFDSTRGPLVLYLGPDGAIRQCPTFRGYATGGTAFELGNGGYGYNNAYVGVQLRHFFAGFYIVESTRTGVQFSHIHQPAGTLMFADSAFAGGGIIEYSFAEPRFHPTTGGRADPSIHFRHRGGANIAWCDGHVDQRRRTFSWSSGVYLADPARYDIGWFGRRDDNGFFDLQ